MINTQSAIGSIYPMYGMPGESWALAENGESDLLPEDTYVSEQEEDPGIYRANPALTSGVPGDNAGASGPAKPEIDTANKIYRAWESRIRGMLKKNPAGAVEMDDGTLRPVRSNSKDNRDHSRLSLLLDKGEGFRVFLMDQGAGPGAAWKLRSVGSNVQYCGHDLFHDHGERKPVLHGFSFSVTGSESEAAPTVFEKVFDSPGAKGEPEVVGTTAIKVVSHDPAYW